MSQTKTLFFIAEAVPSDKEKEAASKIEGKVCLRNARFIVESDNLESCDFVAGKVPKSYRKIPFYGAKQEKVENTKKEEEKKEDPKKSIPGSIWKPN